ncbi:metallophosphoesterase [Actinophytocola gossypii]|uniref:Metallophosphoesterase n=1 Tax=Actinophytocola gossypii TaxID=2812003 RepID=A0ABT2J5N2_9PSEU|nr:metallophosphoesterase [Actinophytocola gossypii]MCT2583178.1 metallophosphoesterase [Actinophytocola gossypii]
MAQPRPRPRAITEEQLGFRPRRAVRWLNPGVLVATGTQSVMANIFGSYADKRELQGTLPDTVHEHRADETWLDFVADLGDGFDATYSVASLLAASSLDVGETLPRGRLLIMGGDQVYPAASTEAYEDRSKGVYRAALPAAPPEAPRLFALPGNHDWYDGLTSFLRVFAQGRPFGGWATEQTRSYFAVELPQRWWLYAIDTQFDDYVDAPQLAYFREAATRLDEGDAVILCTSAPEWVPAGSGGEHKGYDTIEFFLREIVRPRGATVPLMLTGDKHYYTRYTERDGTAQRITCGLGGAYLSGTHKAPEELTLPPTKSRVRDPSEPVTYDLAARYPGRTRSEWLATGIVRLPWRNPGFWALTGVLQTAMTLAVLFGLTESDNPDRQNVFGQVAAWTPAALAGLVLVFAGIAFARIDLPKAARTNVFAGIVHAAGHLALSTGWAFVVRWLYQDVVPDGAAGEWLLLGLLAVVTPVLVGFLDAQVVALYLLVASRFGINSNEAFAGQGIEDDKGFLRLHIAPDGTLTVYPIKLTRICRHWRPNPDGAPTDPWLLPEEPLRPELIEPPIRVPRVTGGAAG